MYHCRHSSTDRGSVSQWSANASTWARRVDSSRASLHGSTVSPRAPPRPAAASATGRTDLEEPPHRPRTRPARTGGGGRSGRRRRRPGARSADAGSRLAAASAARRSCQSSNARPMPRPRCDGRTPPHTAIRWWARCADLRLQPAERHQLRPVPHEHGVGLGVRPHRRPLVVDVVAAVGLAVPVHPLHRGEQLDPRRVVGPRRRPQVSSATSSSSGTWIGSPRHRLAYVPTMLRTTHTSTVTEDQIDHLGHMNVRFYAVNAHAGHPRRARRAPGWGGRGHVVHDTYTRHHREQLLGTDLEVRSAILAADQRGLRLHHELRDRRHRRARRHVRPRPQPARRRRRAPPVPEDVAAAALAAVVPHPEHAAPASISLDTDLLVHTPTLEVVRERGLAMRKERHVSADECDDAGRYRVEMAPMLTWGGRAGRGRTRPRSSTRPPTACSMGWASMETRVQVGKLPTVGRPHPELRGRRGRPRQGDAPGPLGLRPRLAARCSPPSSRSAWPSTSRAAAR